MTQASTAQIDVLTIGRVSVDLYPLQDGVGLEEVETFGKYLGGSATNVAVAAARHGLRSAVITRTGDDPFGRYVHHELGRLGVDDEFVTAVDGLNTPVVWPSMLPASSRSSASSISWLFPTSGAAMRRRKRSSRAR